VSVSTLTAERQAAPSDRQPLVVDLDGSLIHTDTLVESLVASLAHPVKSLRALFALRRGKAALKAALAEIAAPDPALLPYNRELVDFLRGEQQRGRPLILATAADRRIAVAVAQHLDLFDLVLASDGIVNLGGATKLAAVKQALDGRDFCYVGDERRDLAVWRGAASAVTVELSPGLEREVAKLVPVERSFRRGTSRPRALLRAMRPHQWIKNVLVFVPIVTARAVWDWAGWIDAALMFAAFCLTASGIYLINDLCDLAADRQHPEKRHRPLASGTLPLRVGLAAAPLLILAGAAISAAAGTLPVLAIYAAMSIAYSLYFKAQALVDVFLLAGLYSIRLIGGGVATGYQVTLWLLAFSSFLFLGLAMVKRVAELKSLVARDEATMAGRGYSIADLPILEAMGVATSFVTSLVLALYVQNELVSSGGRYPTLAWAIVPLILFWQCRIWLVTARGGMHHDPIVYAARDWVSWLVTLSCFAALLLSDKAGFLLR